MMPTGDGLACVWAGTTSARFRDILSAVLDAAHRALVAEADPELARAVGATAPVGAWRGYPGQPGSIRVSAGPGWALVGDAGYF
jgi:hypothetical protein